MSNAADFFTFYSAVLMELRKKIPSRNARSTGLQQTGIKATVLTPQLGVLGIDLN